MQAYISTFFCREYNIPCQKKVQQNQIKNIIFLLLGGALWVAPTSLIPLVHSQYILCVVAGGMLCIPPTGTQTILQAQTIRTVVLALLVPLVHSQDNTCVTASFSFAHQYCDKSRLLFKRKQPPLLQGRLS